MLLVWIDQNTHGMPLNQRLIQSKALNLFNAKMAEKGEEAGEEKPKLAEVSEKAMAPHSSTLAWEIPWTDEPGRLQSMGSLRVRHD